MAKVIIEHVYKIYSGEDKKADKLAVEDAHFEIEDQEFMVLVGPSGCGKTTTLRMIAGLEDITRGRIYIDGKVVNDLPPKDRDIAMVFQNYALYPHMTVRQNMAFGLELRKTPQEVIDRRVEEAARILGLSHPDNLLVRKPKALSGGQRQRVALGRAIVRQPKAFLFDEPLSNLDAKMRVETRGEISRLHRELKSTMIYVTHDQVEAMTMADRIVVMRNGRIQQIAEPLALYDQPANLFVAGFIGSPAMNFLHGSICRHGGSLWFAQDGGGSSPAPHPILQVHPGLARHLAPFEGKPVVAGIRPEHFEVAAEGSVPRPGEAVEAGLEAIEPLGAETLLHARVGPQSVVVKSRVMLPKRDIGRRLQLAVQAGSVRYFNATSEERIA